MNDYHSQDWIQEPEIVVEIIVLVLYCISFIIYLFKLSLFNVRMKREGLTDKLVNKVDILNTAEKILDGGGKNFLIGAVLFILAFIIVIIVLIYLRNRSNFKGISSFIMILFVLISIILFIILGNMINIPALRAFMILAGSAGIILCTYGRN